MNIDNFSKVVIDLYSKIQNEFEKKRIEFIKEGYFNNNRINYEYIDLEFIFDDLINMISPLIDYYDEYRFFQIKKEMNCIFIATLCEISKRGFSQGGILKQIDEYIGFKFNRNRYYRLIKSALKSENIKVFNNVGHQYEATIVYESGIPKKLHSDLFHLFKIYWKWMRGIDVEERRNFLCAFIERRPIHEEYIIDKIDFQKMCFLRDSMANFQEKVIKTCIRIDKVYSEIDKMSEDVNKDNINEACDKISKNLGYNILTIINEDTLKKDLIETAHCIGFKKFENIIANLLPDEKIKLPTGWSVSNSNYSIENFMCGYHSVRQIIYEVIFPYGLKCRDYYELQRDTIIKRNDQYIYISDHPFPVEVDGYSVNTRELVWNGKILYIFARKIPVASSAYIDGEFIHSDTDVKLQASIRKSWDRLEKCNKLILCIDEIKIFNPKYAMQTVEIRCNLSNENIIRQINQRGHLKIIEKWIDINRLENTINVEVLVKNQVVATKKIEISNLYVYSLQTGTRLQDRLEWKDWYSDERIIIFSKQSISKTNIKIKFQNMFFDMYVYSAIINFDIDYIQLNESLINISKPDIPLIKLRSEVIVYNNCVCILPSVPIVFRGINCIDKNLFLKIVHDGEQFPGKSISEIKNLENISLLDCGILSENSYGKWTAYLYRNQEKICEISFFVLSQISVKLDKKIYRDGSTVNTILEAKDDCFIVDGEKTKTCFVPIGQAKLVVNDDHVDSELIEFEVNDAKCDVPYRLKVKPNVWGVRIQQNGKWITYNGKKIQLNYNSKKDTSLIICSTQNQKIKIQSQEGDLIRYIKPGFNHIAWRYLINNWKQINEFTLFNNFGETIQFQIVFEPNICFKNFIYSNNILSIIFSYYGPVGSYISVVAFINDVKIKKISLYADSCIFDFQLKLDDISNFYGQKLVVQTRLDNEDPEELFAHQIKEMPIKEAEHENKMLNNIVLKNYLKTINIFELTPQKVPKVLNVFDVLNYKRG